MWKTIAVVLAACGGSAVAPAPAARPTPVAVTPGPATPAPATPPPQPFPTECEQYKVAATMLIACEVTPQNIRDALQKELDLFATAWNRDGVGPTPEELHDIVEACTSGTASMNKRAIDEGC